MTSINVDRLFAEGERITPATRAAILADAAAIPALIEIVRNRGVPPEGANNDGWPLIHAVNLLGDLRAEAAIPDLLKLLEDSYHYEIVYSGCIHALRAIGAAALEPTLAAAATRPGTEFVDTACEVLCGLNAHDDRILALLLGGLERNPELFAGYLATYGDRRALEPLLAAVERFELDDDPRHLMANQTFIELEDAIRELGGELGRAQQERSEALTRARQRVWRPLEQALRNRASEAVKSDTPRRAEAKLGRNAPCWCGSGKKYKKCHLGR